jgi:hypothetical protein
VFVTHHGRMGYPEGRPVSVLPATWEDGWPTVSLPFGLSPAAGAVRGILGTDDTFDSGAVGPQWEWVYQPPPGSWEPTAGGLRLAVMPPRRSGDPRTVRNLLTQRMLTGPARVTLQLETGASAPGTVVELGNLGSPYSAIRVRRAAGGSRVEIAHGDDALEVEEGPALSDATSLWLRIGYDARSFASFSYSSDGERFVPVGSGYRTGMLGYRGNRISVAAWHDDRDEELHGSPGFVTLRRFDYARPASPLGR